MSQFKQMQRMMQQLKSGKGRGMFPGFPGLGI
jgi:hypothetical protein